MESHWSRCKLGPTRVYWVVWVPYEDEIIADGYCQTIDAAEAKAKQVAGPDSRQWQAYVAERHHRLRVHEARKLRPAKTSRARVRRYVYEARTSDYDSHTYALAYPILKWTKKMVFVSRHSFPAEKVGTADEPSLQHGPDDKAFVLDRSELEFDGHSSVRCWWRGPFYLRLEDALDPSLRRQVMPLCDVIEALAVLGLSWPCSEQEFRGAYRRLSKQTQPDCWGSGASFVEINDAYEIIKAGLVNWPECA
jgi:hypothetical protein